jgi:type IV secretion system protein VirB6
MATCAPLSTGDAFLSTLLTHIDCQAQAIGSGGYQSLSNPASFVSLVLTGLLTLFVALFGLRMMMGHAPTLRDGLMAVVKIGVVLTLAGSWPAYKTVVYDVIVDAPEQITAAVGGPAALPGAAGDSALIARLQTADSAIIKLTNLGTGREPSATLPSSSGSQQRFPIADDPAFGWARVVFLTSVIAAFSVVRITAGVLLALAPLFAGLLLFDMSRGLVIGWARALVFTLLASVVTALILGVELAVIEPWLAQVVRLRQASTLAPSAPVELLILSLGFAVALFGSMAILLRLAFMTSTPTFKAIMDRTDALPAPLTIKAADTPSPPTFTPQDVPVASSRALVIADAMRSSQRREQQAQAAITPYSTTPMARSSQASGAEAFAIPSPSQTLRRTKPRKSLGAALRDRRS